MNITTEKLKEILELHQKWLRGEAGGQRADLSGANLSTANLSTANLSTANLSTADLSCANLSCANLSTANLSTANLSYADLSYANLGGAYLSGANLSHANLSNANLSGADLTDAKLPNHKICPDGQFVIYKKARVISGTLSVDAIVTLLVSRDAKRVGGLTGRKIRVGKAKVKKIEKLDGVAFGPDVVTIQSLHNPNFTYKVGEWIQPREAFCDDIRKECASGIHGFISKQEAIDYKY